MPKESKERISSLPQVDPVSRPQDLRVVARPVDQTVAPSQKNLLGDLVGGLASISPQLQQYVQQKNTSDALAAVEAGEAAADRQDVLNPMQALSSQDAMPAGIEPAFRPHFDKAYRSAIGQRHAIKIQDEVLGAWVQERMKIGDNPEATEAWLRQQVQERTAGFTDPLMLDHINKSVVAAARNIRGDSRSIQFDRLKATTMEGINSSFSMITNDMTAEDMLTVYNSVIVPSALETGFATRTELAAKMLDRINALSTQMNGRPELFDALKEFKDPATGKTLAELNPQLAEAIEVQRKQADDMAERHLNKLAEPELFRKRISWEKRSAEGNPPTIDEIYTEIGPRGLFTTHEQAMSFWLQQQKAADAQRGLQHQLMLIRNGMGAALDPDDQKKAMDAVTEPLVGQLFAASQDPAGQQQFNMTVSSLINAHKAAGVSVPNSRLKNLFGTVKQGMPAPGQEPSPAFEMLANVYAQLPTNLQSAYVADEDTRLILSRYTEGRSGGMGTQLDKPTALAQAYRSISPEAKAAADRMLKGPEARENMREVIDNKLSVVGWRAVLGFETLGTYPTNEENVTDRVLAATRSYIERNGGDITQGEAEKFASTWFQERYVYDRTANKYVEVPPNHTGDVSADAISAYTEKMRKQWGKDSTPELVHLGNGQYQVRGRGVAGNTLVHAVSLDQMRDEFFAPKTILSQEAPRLAVLQQSLLNGTATPAMLNENAELLAKAQGLGLLKGDLSRKVDEVRAKAFKEGVSSILQNVPKASLDGVDTARQPGDDHKTKVSMASRYFENGQFGKALTVTGEGVVLKTYTDAAGVPTIGVGYNLKANAGTLKEDFRRAGIPAESIEDVVAGRKSISFEQTMRLFDVTYARHEASAQQQIESLYGRGTWMKLPAHRRGVITDLAFQAGDVKQFRQSLDGFINEVGSLDQQNPKVHFRDRNTGQMRADTGRNNLRLNMLNGVGTFSALLQRAGGKPTNKIEAAALTQP